MAVRRGQSPVNALPLTVAKNRRRNARPWTGYCSGAGVSSGSQSGSKLQGMLIEAYSRCDLPAGAVTAASPGDQIETDVSRYRGVIPFRDDGLLAAASAMDWIPS